MRSLVVVFLAEHRIDRHKVVAFAASVIQSMLRLFIESFSKESNAMDAQVKGKKVAKEVIAGKREKFVQLAESRTANAMRAIRAIGKLGNKSHYDYTDADVKKIVGALNREIDALKAKMGNRSGRDEVEFKLL